MKWFEISNNGMVPDSSWCIMYIVGWSMDKTLHLLGEKKKFVSGWGVVRPQGLVNIDNSEKVELALYAHKDQSPYA